MIGIAAPVLGARGELIAALTVSALALRVAKRETEIAELVMDASRRLAEAVAAAGISNNPRAASPARPRSRR